MNPFQYVTAHTPEEAAELIGKNGRYLGGGIDLLDEMKDYIVSPDVLVNVKPVKHQPPSIVVIGKQSGESLAGIAGNVTVTQIAAHKELQQVLPGVIEAANEIGSPQIRNVATLAGNLLQHSHCWYYRQPDIVCLKRGGDLCHAQDGENKYHSLFSGCACIVPTASNLAVIFTSLDGTVDVLRAGKTQTMTMVELYAEAWKNPTAHHSLDPGDFLLSVSIPLKRKRSAYRQASEKGEFDWALVSCAAAGNVSGGNITDARVALGGIAPVPYMVEDAHRFLEGQPLTDDNASKAADIILKGATPLAHNGYKVPLAHTLIRRTLLALNP